MPAFPAHVVTNRTIHPSIYVALVVSTVVVGCMASGSSWYHHPVVLHHPLARWVASFPVVDVFHERT